MPSPAGGGGGGGGGRVERGEPVCFFEANVRRQGAPELADISRLVGSSSLLPPISSCSTHVCYSTLFCCRNLPQPAFNSVDDADLAFLYAMAEPGITRTEVDEALRHFGRAVYGGPATMPEQSRFGPRPLDLW